MALGTSLEMEIKKRNVAVLFPSKGIDDRGLGINEIAKEREPVGIFDLESGVLTHLNLKCLGVLNVKVDTFSLPFFYSTISHPRIVNHYYRGYFGSVDEATSFIYRQYPELKLVPLRH